jgi:hypothetical protein
MIRLQKQGSRNIRRKTNFSLDAVLSGVGALVIFILITAGVFAALRRKLVT